jgi:hypothetical protein
MEDGKTVGEAAVAACNAVRNELDHPCAWGQLHVYGDQQFELTTESKSVRGEGKTATVAT